MIRDVGRLTGSTFDVLVVGGGICGLTIAYDAAQRGLSVALIERDDFGGGASFNHLRTLHGGLRYLQSLDLARARESILERRTLARIAPQAVRPLAFALPLYRSLTRGRLAMRAGLLLDRAIAFDRNRNVPPSLHLPAGRVVSRDVAVQRYPGLRRQGLTGAAVWHDYVTIEADRLTFAWALAAWQHGAVLANHVEARAPILEAGRVAGVRGFDHAARRDLEISARITINATGADLDRLAAPPAGSVSPGAFLKAMNLVTTREAGDEALGGRSPSGRNLFLVPWRGRALFGTWESARPAGPGDADADERDVAAFIAELNQAFPSLDLTRGDVSLVHRGVVPAVAGADGRLSLQGRERLVEPVDGMISIAGAKYTTARRVAERITDRLFAKLQRAPVPCRTASVALPGGAIRDVALTIADARREHDEGLPSDAIPHLVEAYGSRYREVLAIAAERPAWRTRVSDYSPVIGAQLVWAVRHEMALTLADAVVRRTPLGALGVPGEEPLRRAAEIVGTELGWSRERSEGEITSVRRSYEATGRSRI
jgi:glycerol-3-phosphate dehydrogenase